MPAIRFPSKEQGNPLFPLPPDYTELNREGQRLARINACCLQETPEDLVVAWDFFRRTYLFPTPPGCWYGDDLVESPMLHYQMLWSVGEYGRNVWGFPRGYAKSTVCDELILLLTLTRQGFPVSLVLSGDDLVQERFGRFQWALADNELVVDDFGVQRPTKGTGKTWNNHLLVMANGARIRGFSATGRKRGTTPRPQLIVIDDAEYDPKQSTDTKQLRRDFEWLLFRVLMPMGQKGSAMLWIGTMITKQSALWSAATGDDPRFRFWNKQIRKATEVDEKTGRVVSIWEAKNSLDDLELMQTEMGASAYASEMLNSPGEGITQFFNVEPQLCTYYVDRDPTKPLDSENRVVYHVRDAASKEPVRQEGSWREKVESLTRIMTVDYAPTIDRHSDYSAVMVLGFERPYDVLWVLDAFVGKVKDEVLAEKIWTLGCRWWPRVVGVEAVGFQKRLVELVESRLLEKSKEGEWMPKVMPVTYPHGLTKVARISAMEWRFNTYRIKLPVHLRTERSMRLLWEQIEEFNPEARDGNLQHDDAVDALAMYQQVARGRNSPLPVVDERPLTPTEQIARGQILDPRTGLPWLGAVNADELSDEAMMRLVAFGYEKDRTRLGRDLTMRRT